MKTSGARFVHEKPDFFFLPKRKVCLLGILNDCLPSVQGFCLIFRDKIFPLSASTMNSSDPQVLGTVVGRVFRNNVMKSIHFSHEETKEPPVRLGLNHVYK